MMMGMRCSLLHVFLMVVMYCALHAEAKTCNIANTTTSFSLPSDIIMGENCTWTIEKDANKTSMALLLTEVSIMNGDTLTIYDGMVDETKLLEISGSSAISEVAVIFGKQATVVFKVGENNTMSQGTIDFNTAECAANLQNSLALRVTNPVYNVKAKSDASCTYTVTNRLPVDRMAIVSVLGFELGKGSSLTLTSGDRNQTYKGGSQSQLADFFTNSQNENVTISFLLKQGASALQKFSLAFETFVPSCSSDQPITNETVVISETLPTNPDVAYRCRWRVTRDKAGPALLAKVTDLMVTSSDSLTLVSGPSGQGQPLAQFTESVSSEYLVLGSSQSMTATLSLGSTGGPRSVNVSFQALDVGGHFQDHGWLVAGNASTNTSPDGPELLTAYYQLTATQGQIVRLLLKTPLPPNATVTLYRGLQPSDGVLITMDSKSLTEGRGEAIGGAAMLVTLKDFPASKNFTAYFESVTPGCNAMATEVVGQLSLDSLQLPNISNVCTWIFAPQGTGVMVLTFDLLSLSEKSSVVVYTNPDQPIASFHSPSTQDPLPQITVPQDGLPARVSVYLNDTKAAARVTVSYKLVSQVCGSPLTAPQGSVSTPNYPNQYPLNTACEWDVLSTSNTSLLFLSFTSLDLSQKHSISVVDKNNGTMETLAHYMGSANSTTFLPNDLIVPADNSTHVVFSSVAASGGLGNTEVGSGAVLDYWVLECGGNVSAVNGSLASPGYPTASAKPVTCVWIIQLPPLLTDDAEARPDSQSVQFTVTAKGKQAASINKYLKIFDGPGLRFPPSPANASNGTSGTVLSRYTTLTVLFYLGAGVKDQVAFNLTFTSYVCNASEQCDNGLCMHPDWVCNYVDDCGDGTDEQNCVFPRPTPAPPAPPAPPQDYSGYVRKGWVPACLFIGIVLGVALLFIIPRIIRKFRGGGVSYNRMNDDRPVVA